MAMLEMETSIPRSFTMNMIRNKWREMEKVEEEIFRLAISLNGTLSGEHGIGLSKANYMTLEHDPVEMALMKQIKRTLDPNNIMNPGKRALDGLR